MTTNAVILPPEITSIFSYDTTRYTAHSYRNALYLSKFVFPETYAVVPTEIIDDLENPPVIIPSYDIAPREYPLIRALHQLLHQYPNYRITLPDTETLRDCAATYEGMFRTLLTSEVQPQYLYQLIPVFWTKKHAVCYVDYLYPADPPRIADNPTCPDSKLFIYLATSNVAATIKRICTSCYSTEKSSGDWSYPQDIEHHRRTFRSVLTKFVIKK